MNKELTPKMERLVQTARSLFFRHGMKRVSIDEICQEASVSRMTFYKYFKDKDNLVIYIVDKIFETIMNKFNEIIRQNIPFDDKMKQVLLYKMEIMNESSTEFINELIQAEKDTPFGQYLQKKMTESIAIGKGIYSEAQEKGEIKPDLKIELIMNILESTKYLFTDKYIQNLYPDQKKLYKDIFNIIYYGIINTEGDKPIK